MLRLNEETGEWYEDEYDQDQIPEPPPDVTELQSREPEHTPLIKGYGTRVVMDKVPGQWITEWGAPASPEYVKDIDETINAVDTGRMSEADLSRKIARQEGLPSWGGVPAQPSDQQLSVYDQLSNAMEMMEADFIKKATKDADDMLWEATGYATGLPKLPNEQKAWQRVYEESYNRNRTMHEKFFEKKIAADQEQLRHQRNLTEKRYEASLKTPNEIELTARSLRGDKAATDILDAMAKRKTGGSQIPDIGEIATTPPGTKNEAALEGIKEGQKAIVKGLTEYTIPLPSGMALRNPEWQAMLGRAKLYDTSFDATQYNVRMGVRRDFTSGNASRNIRSLNTAVAHLQTLDKAFEILDNAPVQLWNKIANVGITAVGDPRATNVSTAADAVAGELATVFKSTSGTDQEIKEWRKNVGTQLSPKQSKGTVNTAIELLGGRLLALYAQYQAGMGRPADFQILSDKSRSILKGLGVDVDKFDPSLVTNAPTGNLKSGGGKPRLTPAEALEELRRRGKI